MTKGQELLQKWLGAEFTEGTERMSADIDAALRDQALAVTLACCRAVCASCRIGTPYNPTLCEGAHVNTLPCDARFIRAAWLAAHGRPLEDK